MTSSKLIYFKSKTICGSHALLAGEGFGNDSKVPVYSIEKEGKDYFIIFVQNGDKNRKTLHLKYSIEIKETVTPYDGRFTMAMYGDKAVQRNVDELVSWVQKCPVEFNMLRKFLVDAEALMSEWEVLHAFHPVLFKSLLSFLEESPVGIRRFKKIYNDLTAAYYDHLADADGKAEPRQDPVFRYLDLCFDNQNEDWFHDRGEIREQQIIGAANKLLIQNGTESKQSQNNDWNRKRKRVLEKAQSWLLSRYNLCKASKIAFSGQPCRRWIFLALPECLAVIVLLWLRTGPFQPLCFLGRNWVLGSFYFAGIAVAGRWIWSVSRGKKENFLGNNIRLFLPRLAAGIAVGYLVLSGDEAWRDVFSNVLHLSYNWQLIAFPLLGVSVYMYIEISKMTGLRIGFKPIYIFFRGYAYSILTGVIVSDLFGESMAAHAGCALAVPVFHGFFGSIYPRVIFYHAPLALFIGVFLQLLWEDKTLTEKI